MIFSGSISVSPPKEIIKAARPTEERHGDLNSIAHLLKKVNTQTEFSQNSSKTPCGKMPQGEKVIMH
jgi:hypothetical protein